MSDLPRRTPSAEQCWAALTGAPRRHSGGLPTRYRAARAWYRLRWAMTSRLRWAVTRRVAAQPGWLWWTLAAVAVMAVLCATGVAELMARVIMVTGLGGV